MKKEWLWLILILALALFLRVWRLGVNPPHLTPDEAALGYNAFSILKTGKDEYGKILPLIFKSFGDYKPGLYIYLTVPFIAFLGLTEFAVRLPSALMGVLAVFFIFLIVNQLFKRKRLALISSLLLAISPWQIHFSRGAWEINLCLALTLIGIYFFLKSVTSVEERKQKVRQERFLIASAAFFGLTLLSYQGAKLSSAIVVLLLGLIYLNELLKFEKKNLTIPLIVGLLISLPVVLTLFQGKAGRLKVFSVFSHHRPVEYLQAQLNQGEEKVGDLSYYLFHSETANIFRGIMGRWFNHYSGRFLFFEGDWQNPRHSAPNQGVLLTGDILLLIVGLVALIKTKEKREALFVLFWFLLAPLPAALSKDQVHAVRAYNLVVPTVIILGLGMEKILKVKYLNLIFLLGYLASFVYFLDAYFVHLPIHDSIYWEYGYKQAVLAVNQNKNRYQKVHFRQSFAQPYIYYLFYTQYNPTDYQKQAHLIESESGDVGRVEQIDNVYFLPIDWTRNRGDSDTIFVADVMRIPPQDSVDPKEFEVIDEIKYLNGEMALRVIGVK